MIAEGGKAVYGANIGILMLEARFPRIPGDMGNALSWPFPVHYRVVRGASPDRVVRRRAEGLLDAFIEIAAKRPDWDLLIVGGGQLEQQLRGRRLPIRMVSSACPSVLLILWAPV